MVVSLCFAKAGGSIATLTLAQRAPPAAAMTFKSCLLTSAAQRSVNAASSFGSIDIRLVCRCCLGDSGLWWNL